MQAISGQHDTAMVTMARRMLAEGGDNYLMTNYRLYDRCDVRGPTNDDPTPEQIAMRCRAVLAERGDR